jgi:RNA polymerase sigma-70 factor (ECF subfamily)
VAAAEETLPQVPEDVTELLARWSDGAKIHSRVMPLIYSDLRRLASALSSKERMDNSLQTTSLVTEAYLRLFGSGPFENRVHFFGAAARAMRRVLVDHARRRGAAKRGGPLEHVELDEECSYAPEDFAEQLAVNDALVQLEAINRRQHDLVEMRYFSGMTLQEAAEALGISLSTAKEDWRKAKEWLKHQLKV